MKYASLCFNNPYTAVVAPLATERQVLQTRNNSMSKRIKVGEDKIYDVDLPIPKFNQFDPVLYNGIRTEIANSTNYYARNDNDIIVPLYYVPTLLDGFIYIELVPETDLTKFIGN